MQINKVQQAIANALAKDISNRINSEVQIGEIDYQFFNSISLKNIYIEDLQGDTLLYIAKTNAHFDFFKIFKKKIKIHSIELDNLYGNLAVDTVGQNNFSFLIDAFSNPDKKNTESNVEYSIQRLNLTNSSLRFNKASATEKEKFQNQFDASRLYIHDINTEIVLNILNNDTLNAQIVSFSCAESSGLKIKDLKTSITASTTAVEIPELIIKLPNSSINFGDLSLKYDSVADFQDFPKKVKLNANLNKSELMLSDLSALVPDLKKLDVLTSIEMSSSGTLSNLHVPNINIQYGESFVLNGNLALNGLPDIEQTFIYANIKELRLNGNDTENFISELTQRSFKLPQEAKNLGIVRYKGNITGFFSNIVFYGALNTNIGNISTDVSLQFANKFSDLQYNGTIKSRGLELGKLTKNENLGKMSFYFNTKGYKKANSSFHGTVDANIPELVLYSYNYKDIRFDGKYDGSGFNGTLKIEDENIDARFDGLIDLTQQLPVFDFELSVKNVNFNALNLTEKYNGAQLSFNGKTNMVGNSLDNLNGLVSFDNINFTNKENTLDAGKIEFTSRTEKNYTNFAIKSNYLNGAISGNFKYSTILQTTTRLLQDYLPALGNGNVKSISDRIDIDLTFENTDKIAAILELPYSFNEKSTIKGYSDESKDMIDIIANVPKFSSGSQSFNNTMLHIWGKDKMLELIVETNVPTKNDFWNFMLYSSARRDTAALNIEWRNKQESINEGEIRTVTNFAKTKEGKTIATTSILPTQIVISDSLWSIAQSSINFNPNRKIQINKVHFGNKSQYIDIDGVLSEEREDSVKLQLKDLDLGFVSTLARMTGFHIGGKTTGEATIYSALNRPIFDASLFVKDTKLNHKWLGDVSVFSTWDAQKEQVVAIASIDAAEENIALGECTYTPKTNYLDINLDAKKINIDFLTPYFEKILPNTQGYASGKLNIGGTLDAIRFNGRLKVTDGRITVAPLGSTFYFNDTIALTSNAIEFPNMTLYDIDKNKVSFNGSLKHSGFFKDFKYDLNVQTKNAQIMNLRPAANTLFFGKAYGAGSVRISGDEDNFNIRVNALTKPGTKAYIQMASSGQATDANFIQFVKNTQDEDSLMNLSTTFATNSSTNMKLDIQLEVTPEAEIEFIVDPVSGDMISGKGSGNIRIEYDDRQSGVKMYGSYVIDNGSYLFTLQDVFRKEFKIQNGSSIYWSGSPNNAQVNIRAIYSLSASLKDLMTDDESFTNRGSVPVNCMLHLTDNLMLPTIKFNIDLPASDESIKQHVRRYMNTEEILTRQVLYLLVFNKFYTPESSNLGTNEFMSLAASTVSSQINNIASQMFKNLSVGFDWRRADNENMEYEVGLQYQPNSRWVVSGNFGYRDNYMNNSGSIDKKAGLNNFITDIDVEYLLTESGKFRLKAYNHTVDRIQLRTARNTQGIGFMYKEDFDSVGGIFRYYWQLITSSSKKKDNEENTTNN